MSLPLKLNFSDYDNFLTEPNYTTSAEAQDYFRNMDMLVEALIAVGLWQPETNYPNGHVVFSPNMPNGTEAVCVATTGGKSSNTEPSWGEVGGDNISDGTCFWKLRWKHWSKDKDANAVATVRNNLETNIRSYRTLAEAGCNYSMTIDELCGALPVSSVTIFFASKITTSANYLTNITIPVDGTVFITKSTNTTIPVELRLVEQLGDGDVYVGRYTTVQNKGFSGWRKLAVQADVANVMQAVEQVQTGLNSVENKLPSDMTDYIVESYRNGTEWYEVYKSGKVRQGGRVDYGSWVKAWSKQVTFLKSFVSVDDYDVVVSVRNFDGNGGDHAGECATTDYSHTTTGFILNQYSGNDKSRYGSWVAEGQGA